jgi:hypothetical protein
MIDTDSLNFLLESVDFEISPIEMQYKLEKFTNNLKFSEGLSVKNLCIKRPVTAYLILKRRMEDGITVHSKPVCAELFDEDDMFSIDDEIGTDEYWYSSIESNEEIIATIPCKIPTYAVYGRIISANVFIEFMHSDIEVEPSDLAENFLGVAKLLGYEVEGLPHENWEKRIKEEIIGDLLSTYNYLISAKEKIEKGECIKEPKK